jgi:hypothetical protein
MCLRTFALCMWYEITFFADKFEIARKSLSRAEDSSCLESSSEHGTKQRRKRPPPQFTDESDSDHLPCSPNIGLPRPEVPPELNQACFVVKSVLGIDAIQNLHKYIYSKTSVKLILVLKWKCYHICEITKNLCRIC